ncbi:MAG TPA: hypothetical protein VGB81_01890 [Devosia sp.]|jgi:Mg2+ and Co2+ transporter CorA
MKTVQTIIGVILVLLGGLWIGQGANLIGGSFMSGQSQWLFIGIVVALVGLGLLFLAYRPRQPR